MNQPLRLAPGGALRTFGCAALFAAALTACGGGGGDSPAPAPAPTPTPTPTPGGLPASSTLAQQCAATNTLAPVANRTTTLDTERRWVRSYVNEAYLWYSEVPTVDTALAAYNVADVPTALDNYFSALLSPVLTASGKRRDQFSFTYPTAAWTALSQSGAAAGYGIEWATQSPTPPRNIRIAYVDPATPAAAAGLARGLTLLTVNGVSADDATPAGVAVLNEAIFSPKVGTAYTFTWRTLAGTTVSTTMTAATVTKVPVQNVKVVTSGARRIGYLTFNDHLLPAEGQLVTAFQTLSAQAVTDLVLDLRYNGGGFLYIASQVAYMIAGNTRTTGKVFEKLQFNDKRTAETNDPNNTTPFFNTTSGFSGSGTVANAALPQLNLARVIILTQGGTCSASESIVNSLRGIDVEVVLVGGTTCGKPYGFTAKDNCGISYFPIEFKGVNAKAFGDYADGFAATCRVSDDYTKALGDPAETQFAAGITYASTGACPAGTGALKPGLAAPATAETGYTLMRHRVRESKYR